MLSNLVSSHRNFAAILSVIFATLGVILHQSGVDLALATKIFQASGNAFSLRDNFWFKDILHDRGKHIIQLGFLLVVGLQIYLYRRRHPREQKANAWFVFGCAAVTLIIVGVVKSQSTLPCPWSLVEFGGQKVFVPLISLFDTAHYPLGKCFPAGHAAGVYAWLCVAFIFPLFSKKFWQSFCTIFLLGLSYSLVQNLRGAHFISHDCFSIALSFGIISIASHMRSLSTKK